MIVLKILTLTLTRWRHWHKHSGHYSSDDLDHREVEGVDDDFDLQGVQGWRGLGVPRPKLASERLPPGGTFY